MRLSNPVDRFIGFFSPERAIRRHIFRERLTKIRSAQYAAAKTTRTTGAWSPIDSNVNDIIGASSPKVRSRIRQLVRDFPYFARAVEVLTDYTVGPGIMFQSRIQEPDGKKLDSKRIQQTEDVFNFWADEADYAGQLHYYEMMQLAKRQDTETGEFLFVKKFVKQPRQYLPFSLQMIEADWLTSLNTAQLAKGNEIDQGVEFNKTTGRRVAFHFTDPDSWGKTIRVKAEDVIHGFKTLRPGQLRGISAFAPGVLMADDLHNLMESEIDAAKMASKWLALVYTDDPASWQNARNVQTDSETGQKIEELENAIIDYLRPGEKIEFKSNPRPGNNFHPFVRLMITMFAITAGAPYELISGDYQGLNYSTGKMVRNDFAQQLRPISVRHVRHFAQATFRPVMDIAVMAGKLEFPGYFMNPAPYLRSEWQPPGMEPVDPLRETKSRLDEIAARIRSPQEIIKARGRDPEEVVKEIAAFKQLCEDNELDFGEVSTALANNPAAVENQRSSPDVQAQIYEIMDALENLSGRI